MRELNDYLESDSLRRHVQTVNFDKGQLILGPNHSTKYIHVIKTGLVKIYNFDSRGSENIAVIYGPGDIFPLAWIINQVRPSLYFRALSDCSIYLLQQQYFQKLIRADRDLYDVFVRHVAEQFALLATTINNLGLKYGRERVCYRLLLTAVRYGENQQGVTVLPHINQADLALTIKMTRESVSKEIAWLERQGVLEFDRTSLIIKNQEFLQNVIGKGVPVIFFDNI